MRERAELILKIACWGLVALLLFQLLRAIHRDQPFAQVTIPAVPTLASATNATAEAGSAKPPGMMPPGPSKTTTNSGTNLPATGTNQVSTNVVKGVKSPGNDTNPPSAMAVEKVATNSPAMTNALVMTNAPALTNVMGLTNSSAMTNSLGQTNSDKPGTNGVASSGSKKKSSRSRPPMMGMGGGIPGMFGMGGGKALPELPPVARARIDQIVNSELLGPIMHPMPMGLMGIAGNVAFLRSDSGETGLVKVGDSLGDLTLIRIGINRVLVEQNGQQQELTIFSGMGSDSLITTPDKNSNETTNH